MRETKATAECKNEARLCVGGGGKGEPGSPCRRARGEHRCATRLVLLGEVADREHEVGRVRREQVGRRDVPRVEGGLRGSTRW